MTPIADAPRWLSDAVREQRCAGCDSPRTVYIGLYVPSPEARRRYAYAICPVCIADTQRVAERVERRVATAEACAAQGKPS